MSLRSPGAVNERGDAEDALSPLEPNRSSAHVCVPTVRVVVLFRFDRELQDVGDDFGGEVEGEATLVLRLRFGSAGVVVPQSG